MMRRYCSGSEPEYVPLLDLGVRSEGTMNSAKQPTNSDSD